MAAIGKWTGGAVSILPSTSWGAPNGMFTTTDRNDGGAYSLSTSNSTLTLPSSNLADGYLLIGAYELEDTSNGRCNPQGRFLRTGGTGTFTSAMTSSYNRDASEDRSYIRTWAFIDSPSASSTIAFQWRRDADAPTGGTRRAELQIIPLYYSDFGIYESASTSCPANTTPSQITGFSGTDGTNITVASNVVTVSGDNKRYLCLGSYYWQGIGNARTQRWGGFRIDGTKDDSCKGYSYARNTSNADIGEFFSTIIETATANRTIDMFIYRGDGVANGQGGADVTGNTTGSNPAHRMVILELHDNAEVFKSKSSAATGDLTNTSGTAMPINEVTEFNDTESFTDLSNTSINCVKTADYLFGADISMASNNVANTGRHTMFSEFTVNGVNNPDSFAGDYLRNNQSTQDTFGISNNLLGFESLSAGDDVGVETITLTGSEAQGDPIAPAGWVGFWGVNLDTLEGAAPSTLIGGQIATSGQFALFRETTRDGSIQDAVKGVTGIDYNDIVALATNCNNALIDSDHGTRNVTPTNALQFRGYPRPEVMMNYEIVPNVNGYISKDDIVADAPFLNFAVGFDITVTLTITERRSDNNALLGTHNETFTFAAGGTSVTSSSITPTGGFYKLNDYQPTDTYSVNVSITYSANKGTYQTETYPYTDSLTYVDATPVYYPHTIFDPNGGSGCSMLRTNQRTLYSADQVLGVGSELFTDTALTNEISSFQTYIRLNTETESGGYDYFYYNGAIQFYTECF